MKPRIFYFPEYRSSIIKPEVTIAAKRIDENTVAFAYSVCSLEDNFNKKKGRTIAIERLENANNPFYFEVEDNDSKYNHYVDLFFNNLTDINGRHPHTVSMESFDDMEVLFNRIFDAVKY